MLTPRGLIPQPLAVGPMPKEKKPKPPGETHMPRVILLKRLPDAHMLRVTNHRLLKLMIMRRDLVQLLTAAAPMQKARAARPMRLALTQKETTLKPSKLGGTMVTSPRPLVVSMQKVRKRKLMDGPPMQREVALKPLVIIHTQKGITLKQPPRISMFRVNIIK